MTRTPQPSFSARGPEARRMLDDLASLPALRLQNKLLRESIVELLSFIELDPEAHEPDSGLFIARHRAEVALSGDYNQ